MRKRRLLALLLILCLLTGPVLAAGSSQPPYAIKVNRAWNTVTIYGLDANGQHTIPVKAMICSTARPGYVTPLGSYTLAEYRSPWRLMLDGTYGQFATCFSGNYLFHSICYADDSHDAMIREAYNNLGNAASMGCVRLETIDAKWIYDNCPAGTPVTVYDDPQDPGPLGKPARTVDEISPEAHNGWDPTDPAAGNPWHLEPVSAVEGLPETLTMTAGESLTLEVNVVPQNAVVFWSGSDESVVRVEAQGRLTALAAGTAQVTVRGLRGAEAHCTITVEGDLLPFSDLTPGAWYYSEVRGALESGLFKGMSGGRFAPDLSMTRAMVVQALYNLEKRPKIKAPDKAAFPDVTEDDWYHNAVLWAASEELVKGISGVGFAPDRPMTRQDLAAILWRYAGSPEPKGDLSGFTDGAQVRSYAHAAMAWLTEKGLLKGSHGYLFPDQAVSRAETAAILQRFAAR